MKNYSASEVALTKHTKKLWATRDERWKSIVLQDAAEDAKEAFKRPIVHYLPVRPCGRHFQTDRIKAVIEMNIN